MNRPSRSQIENGTMAVLAERTIRYRIPRALRLKEKVDGGERLSDYELKYMIDLMLDFRNLAPFLEEHPEWTTVAGKMAVLYSEIAEGALENEQSKSPE